MSKIYVDEILPKDNATVDGSKLSALPSSAMPAGSVIQAVNEEYSDVITSTSSSAWTDTISLSITPSATSSKIAVYSTFPFIMYGQARVRGGFQLLRDSTVIQGGSNETAHLRDLAGSYECLLPTAMHYIDSPNTTSEVTYKIQIIMHSGMGAGTGVQINGNTRPCHMSLMEIAG